MKSLAELLRMALFRALSLALALALWPCVAQANWQDGRVPARNGPWTVGANTTRLSLFGRSAVGLGDRTEISTLLPVDLVLFPNLAIKHRFIEDPHFAAAYKLGLGFGLLPLAGATVLPTPFPFVGGGVGLAAGSVQSAGVQLAWRPGRLCLTGRGGLFAAEGVIMGVGGGASVGAVVPVGFATGQAVGGWSAGTEATVTLGPRNAAYLSGDVYHLLGLPNGMIVASAAWMHAWRHTHLVLGLYSLIDLPDAQMLHSALPVSPMANLYWTFGKGQRSAG
ncbi:MAG: hypothetical protein GXP62_20625 [Oligoflexia bacterium]|nr:hypothetical protein [Oligoflexia bacterium]